MLFSDFFLFEFYILIATIYLQTSSFSTDVRACIMAILINIKYTYEYVLINQLPQG
jgi:hypothetical protein